MALFSANGHETRTPRQFADAAGEAHSMGGGVRLHFRPVTGAPHTACRDVDVRGEHCAPTDVSQATGEASGEVDDDADGSSALRRVLRDLGLEEHLAALEMNGVVTHADLVQKPPEYLPAVMPATARLELAEHVLHNSDSNGNTMKNGKKTGDVPPPVSDVTPALRLLAAAARELKADGDVAGADAARAALDEWARAHAVPGNA
eukprot:gene30786-23648_t